METDTPAALVAIGASAGGLMAFRSIFEAMPDDSGACFVLAQHLPPGGETLMAGALTSACRMPVLLAEQGTPALPDRVYIAPSHRALHIADGRFHLAEPPSSRSPALPLDRLFQSLASAPVERLVVVILSGTGNDGSGGLRAVKDRGGLILVQDPATAEFDGMPRSALRTGLVDGVPAPEDMPAAILEFLKTGRLERPPSTPSQDPDRDQELLTEVLALLRGRINHDFRGYKRNTLRRRIDRRMGLAHIADLEAYLRLLREKPDEVDRLGRDLLIGVTAFFRDPDAFEILGQQVIPAICGERPSGMPVRIWIAGCSTGEEAYSIAALVLDWMLEHRLPPLLQVFATDVDEGAVEAARAGRFGTEAVGALPRRLLERYFASQGGEYRIDKRVREAIVFSVHNLVSDPPFSRMDLVVCRNVMIYLDPPTQARTLALFRAVLNPGGYLFLGSSESLGAQAKEFETVSKQWRIFKALGVPPRVDQALSSFPGVASWRPPALPRADAVPGTPSANQRQYRQLLEKEGPLLVLTNRRHEMLYAQGPSATFLEVPPGEPTHDLYDLVRPFLRVALRTALNRAIRTKDKASTQAIKETGDGKPAGRVRVSATPVPGLDRRRLYLLSFETEADSQHAVPADRTPGDGWVLQQLEQELDATREDLQRTIERLMVSNEEMKAAHEEAMAMNEELQSANEELESSKEELQSLNEELSASNAALDVKVSELEAANTDLTNLFASSDVATLFLDRELRVRRFTPACAPLLHLIAGDLGRPIADLSHPFLKDGLAADGETVLGGGDSAVRELEAADGRWFIRRLLPYTTLQGTVAGLVATFAEVTSIKNAQRTLERHAAELERQAQLLDLAHVLARDLDDRIVFWNKGAERFYGWTRDQAEGQLSHELLRTQFPVPLAEIMGTLMADGQWRGELVHMTRSGQAVVVASQWELHRDRQGHPTAVVEVNNDITERKRFEVQLIESHRSFEHLAHHDPLTQLPNRVLFRDRMERAMLLAAREKRPLAFLFVDLDRFKLVNDSLGHEVGDRLLLAVAERMRAVVGEENTLARFGGDEFAVLMEHLDSFPAASDLATALIAALDEPFRIDEQELFIGASVGISIYPTDAPDADGLIKSADAAMYLAKAKGRGNHQFFTHELNVKANRHLSIETRLRRATERGELRLVYQPQLCLESGEVVGAEALLRWDSPELGAVPTLELIQVAEETGLIVGIGEWVLHAVCGQIRAWDEAGLPPIRVAVNISAAQFHQPRFEETVPNALALAGIDPGRLELELTERILLDDVDLAIGVLAGIKHGGVRLSIDDFGTGYSSLSYLRRLPLDQLKVPREFLPSDQRESQQSIARAVVSLAKSLGLECTVEGVETLGQLSLCREWGSDNVQGYLYSRPLPPAEFEAFVRSPTRLGAGPET